MHRAGVVGLGIMGAGIAEVCARAGLDVLAADGTPGAALAGRERVIGSLRRAVAAGKLTAAAGEAALRSIRFTTDLAEFTDRDLVVEAITEDEGAKSTLLAALDTIVGPHAILATNTSSIPIMKLAVAAGRSSQFIGIHFFNPAPVLSLVEVIPCLLTSDDTRRQAEAFVTALGKTAICCPDRAGFMVNALLIPYLLDAIRMAESGFASAADIDSGMVLGCGLPMGPLRLADLIGLDTVQAIAVSMHREYAEPRYAPPPLLRRMVDAGLLGRKSGRGFHDYARPPGEQAGRNHQEGGPKGSEPDQRHASHLSTR